MPSLTYYFGYGSNLWLQQMSLRCPSSTYVGIARLSSYRWIINDRGYANIVQTNEPSDLVYGLVYTLTPDNEERLDRNEGVPRAYTKEIIPIEFWSLKAGEEVDLGSGDCTGIQKDMLVYINRVRVEGDKPKAEYIHRMNLGVRDAVKIGMPQAYVDNVIRQFIPAEGDGEAKAVAEKQALWFEDEC